MQPERFKVPLPLFTAPLSGIADRKEFARSIGENSVHGSDAPETAAQEIAYWFAGTEIVG